MIKKVYRDGQNNVINIGEWDFMREVNIDYDGNEVELIHNPIPYEATFADEEVIILDDGGFGAANP